MVPHTILGKGPLNTPVFAFLLHFPFHCRKSCRRCLLTVWSFGHRPASPCDCFQLLQNLSPESAGRQEEGTEGNGELSDIVSLSVPLLSIRENILTNKRPDQRLETDILQSLPNIHIDEICRNIFSRF